MIKLITFLGNPGVEHAQTRHNIGWMMADCCDFLENLTWIKKFQGLYAVQIFNGEKTYFLKPHIHMNKSGVSVQQLLHFFKIKPEYLLVVHDDIELDFGWIEFKMGGSLSGHNGLRSIAQRLNPEEKIQLPDFLQRSVQALEYILTRGNTTALKKYKKMNLL